MSKNLPLNLKYRQFRSLNLLFTQATPCAEILDWFVGFCEGDGCFYTYKRQAQGLFKFSLEITQKNVQLLQYIQQSFGFGKIYLTKKGTSVLMIRKKKHLLQCLVFFC